MYTRISPLLIAVFVLSFSACELVGTPFNDGNEEEPPQDSVQQAYYEDAQQLAIRKMAEENDNPVEYGVKCDFPSSVW